MTKISRHNPNLVEQRVFTTPGWWARMPCPCVPCSCRMHLRAVSEPHGNLRWGLLSWGDGGWEERGNWPLSASFRRWGQACCRGTADGPESGHLASRWQVSHR